MNNSGKKFILLGLLLIAAALLLAGYNLYDESRAKRAAVAAVNELEESIPVLPEREPLEQSSDDEPLIADRQPAVPDHVLCPNMEMPVETINGIDFIGVLLIPVLELELPIISGWSYPALKTAPCRYSGSAYLNDLIICGHNYASHFGNLKSLQTGDSISFTDMDGNEFLYEVVELETLQPTAIEELEQGEWDLTLFTCTVGGQSRVVVRCKAVIA